MTIHNLQFQGEYGREVLGELFNLDASYYDDGTVRFDTAVNFMKTGILYADKVIQLVQLMQVKFKLKPLDKG